MHKPKLISWAITVVTFFAGFQAAYQPANNKYDLLVRKGQGTGKYEQGRFVKIEANKAPKGYVFKKWRGGKGYIKDVYSSETEIKIPDEDLMVKAIFQSKKNTGIRDIDIIRQQIRINPTTPETEASHRAALYRWWRFMWRQGYDMSSFDEIADQLLEYRGNSTKACNLITKGFKVLEKLYANPVYISEVKGDCQQRTSSKTDWPFYHSTDGSNSGYSPDSGPCKGELAWKFAKSDGWNAEPVIEDGKVYISGAGSDVIAYSLDEETGKLLWKGRKYGERYYSMRGSTTDPIVSKKRILIRAGGSYHFFDKETGNRIYPNAENSEGKYPTAKEVVAIQTGKNQFKLINSNTGKFIWSFNTEGVISGDPIVGGRQVFTYTRGGKVYGFNYNNYKPIWESSLNTHLRGEPSYVKGNKLLVTGKDQNLYAFDATNGKQIWTFRPEEEENKSYQFYSKAELHDGKIYIGAASGYLYCLDAATGKLNWKYQVTDWIRSKPVVLNNVIYVATLDAKIIAIKEDGNKGSKLWSKKIGKHGFASDLVGNKKGLLATNMDRMIYAISPETGFVKWRHSALDGAWVDNRFYAAGEVSGQQSSPTIVDNTLYIAGPDGFVNAVDTETGNQLWRFEAGARISSTPTVADSKVFFGQAYESHGEYFAVDAKTGEPIWTSTEFGSVWVGAAYANDRLFIGNMTGEFFALDPDSGEKYWSYNTAKNTRKEDYSLDQKRGHGYPPGVYCNPATDSTYVYTGSWSGYYFAFNQKTGELLWRTKTTNEQDGGLPDSSAPVLHKNHLYVQKLGAYIAAINKKNGGIEWEWKAPPGFLQNGTIAAVDDKIFGSVVRRVIELPYNATIYAFNDVKNGGDMIWKYEGGGGLTAPVATNNQLISGSSGDVFITSLNPDNGSVQWRFYTGGMMLESVPAIYGNKVFALTKSGFLYAIE